MKNLFNKARTNIWSIIAVVALTLVVVGIAILLIADICHIWALLVFGFGVLLTGIAVGLVLLDEIDHNPAFFEKKNDYTFGQ